MVLFMSRGEIPYWVYKRDTSDIQSSHYDEISSLNDKIKNLEEENRKLRERVKELESKLEIQK